MKTTENILQWCDDRGIRIEPDAIVWYWKAGTLWLTVIEQHDDSGLDDTRVGFVEVVRTHRDDGSSILCFEIDEEIPIWKAPPAFRQKYEAFVAEKTSNQSARLTEVFRLARSSTGAGAGHQLVELAASLSVGLKKADIERCKVEAKEVADVKEISAELDLIRAILIGDVDAIEMADDNLEYDINTNFSPLLLATICGCSKMVSALIDAGADVNLAGSYRATALHYAAHTESDDSIATVKELIKAGAEVNAVDLDGMTPLHLAVMSDRCDIAHILIDVGADIDATDDAEDTPLHLAVCYDKPRAVALLINSGAQLNMKNSQGRTALEFAKWRSYTAVSEMLIRAGAVDAI